METDNKPGAPATEPIKPTTSNELRPSFSFNDLIFDDAFTSDNRKFLRFFVQQEDGYLIDVLKIEYLQYIDLYTDLYDKQMEKDSCTCDICNPQFDTFGEYDSTFTIVDKDGNETEINEKYPIYYVWDLPSNLTVGLHSKEEHP